MRPTNISQFGKGAIIKPFDIRDYRLELLATATNLPKEYEIKYGGKIKHQGTSGSCVAQGIAYYAQALNYLETGEWTELSAKFIYSRVYQPEGGAYVDDGLKVLQNEGIALEEDVPSYKDGQPPDEAFMREKVQISGSQDATAKQYIIKKYLTWENTNVDWYKQAIFQGHGCLAISWGNNVIWEDGDIELPDNRDQMVWLHLVYFVGWSDEKKAFKVLNSWNGWGYEGYGWLPYEYVEKGYVTNPKTMIDVPNDTYLKLMSQYKNLLDKVVELLKKLIRL